MKKQQLTSVLAVLCLAWATDSGLLAAGPTFTNYGFTNLTYDYRLADDVSTKKVETALEGNTLHMLWQEGSWDPLAIYYRRSNDLGLTWQEPVAILPHKESGEYKGGVGNKDFQVMVVKDGVVNIVVTKDWNDLYYLRSTDGIHFEETQIAETGGSCEKAHMRVVGSKVAIAYWQYNRTKVALSEDGGKHFTIIEPDVPVQDGFYDFAYDGQHMVIYTADDYGYYVDYGHVYVSYSDDNGKTFKHTLLSPALKQEDGSTEYRSWLWRANGRNWNQTQFLALEGNMCYAIFESRLSEDDRERYSLFALSKDYGKTWSEPKRIDNDKIKTPGWYTGHYPNLQAKGDNVYVMLQSDQPVGQYELAYTMFHSHDRGETFEAQDGWVASNHTRGHLSDYEVTFDPNDKTGKVVYITNNDYCWIKTEDGFKTLSKATFNDNDCPDGVGFWDNLLTRLEIDQQGTRHWFVSYLPAKSKRRDVSYRRDAGEPAPKATDQAFHAKAVKDGRIGGRVNIPMAANYRSSKAFTVETWVKLDDVSESQCLAFHSHVSGQSEGYGFSFWAVHSQYWRQGGATRFQAVISNNRDDRTDFWPGAQYWPKEDVFVEANKWYHLALTVDAEAETARFYINGACVHEQPFYGEYDWGWNPIILGHKSNSGVREGYELDNFRLWNRALNPAEVEASMKNISMTKADGLRVNLCFDGTLKDLSGYGNDAYAMSDVEFNDVNRTLPQVAFDYYRTETGEVKFTSRTDGSQLVWNFGDDAVSSLRHPSHTYQKPGEYLVTLNVTNATAQASTQQRVVIEGLNGISPTKAGNQDVLHLTITGGGLTERSRVRLERNGQKLEPLSIRLKSPGVLVAQIKMEGAEVGLWDVVVDNNRLTEAFTVEEAQDEQPWVSVDGRSICLYNKWQTYTINYGNRGNVDAYNVPIFFLITHYDDMEFEMIDFDYMKPDLNPDYYDEQQMAELYKEMDAMGDYILVDGPEGKKFRYYPFMVPVIKAGSSNSVHIRIKSPDDFGIYYWTTDPWGLWFDDGSEPASALTRAPYWEDTDEDPEVINRKKKKREQADCFMEMVAWGFMDAAISAIPIVGCVWSVGKTGYQLATDKPEDRFWNLGWNVIGTATSCVAGLAVEAGKLAWRVGTVASMFVTGAADVANGMRCKGNPLFKGVDARSSWDPNEMVGPAGYRDAEGVNWMKSGGSMPYTILFENKAQATAPAHTVFVSDTLDVTKFNLADFNFTSVGWGDTIVSLNGSHITEFCRDIDLRPSQQLIVRTSGKLHPETGIVEWNFISLNPETMEEEEDPMIGFLPPNDQNHRGEGFVSFVVGQQLLSSGDHIANKASIIFDANAPILTNTYVNAIDDDKPTSAAYLVTEQDSELKVQWTGSDASSGVAHYEVWMTKNDGEFENVSMRNPNDYLVIHREPLTKYGFYTIVTDHVGNVEEKSQLSEILYTTDLHEVTLQTEPELRGAGGRSCEVILPRPMGNVRLTVLAADGHALLKEKLGSGQRFRFVLPSAGGSVLVIEAGDQRFVWKVAVD